MKSTLATVAALAVGTNAGVYHEDTLMVGMGADQSLRFVEGFRGAWLGFNKGLYKNGSSMSEDCLNDETTGNFIDAIVAFTGGDEEGSQGDLFGAIGKMTYVLANLNSCNFRQPMNDIVTYCGWDQVEEETEEEDESVEEDTQVLSKKLAVERALRGKFPVSDGEIDNDLGIVDDIEAPSKCSMGAATSNLSKNMFTLLGKSSVMAETLKEFPAETPEELFAQSLELGEDFGTFLRVATDFDM